MKRKERGEREKRRKKRKVECRADNLQTHYYHK